MRIWMGICLLVGICTSANATDWGVIDRTQDGSIFYLDADSIRDLTDDKVQAWVKVDLSRSTSHVAETMKLLVNIHCDSKTQLSIHWINYDKDGVVIDEVDVIDDVDKYKPVTPDTPIESIMNVVCGNVAEIH